MNRRFITLAALFLFIRAFALSPLEQRIADIIGDVDMGVAVISDLGDTIAVNGDRHFELQSVYKFHQAYALARVLPFDEMMNRLVEFTAADLRPGTWSPLRAAMPEGGSLPLPGLLYYSLRMSDNNVADILFDRFLKPAQVDSVLKAAVPARDFAIANTEAELHADPSLSEANFSTPLDCAILFDRAFAVDTAASMAVVKAVLLSESEFGKERIVKGIGNGTVFHKTGTGYADADGRLTAVNDAAFVYYPRSGGDLGFYSIAVFAADCEQPVAEKKMAEISEAVWSHYIMRSNELAVNSISAPAGIRRPSKVKLPRPNYLADALGAIVGGVVESTIDRVLWGEEGCPEPVRVRSDSDDEDNNELYSSRNGSKSSSRGASSTSQRRPRTRR